MPIHIFQASTDLKLNQCTIIYKGSIEKQSDADSYVQQHTFITTRLFAHKPSVEEISNLFPGYTYNDQVIIPVLYKILQI